MQSSRILFWSVTVALGGFLFGFDTAVISGAEQKIQQVWQLDSWTHGLAIAIALYGTVLGALFGGIPSDRLGRKTTLLIIAALYLVSAIGSAVAQDVNSFMVYRFLGGLGVGASSVAAPMYISEISPARSRGKLVALFQFNVVFGIVIAYISNYFLKGINENDWRWMLGVEAIPAIAFLVLLLLVPESPRWLFLKKNNPDAALKVMKLMDQDESHLRQWVAEISQDVEKPDGSDHRSFFSSRYKKPILLAFLFAFFNQVSGINAIIYYAPRIFEMTGLSVDSALLSTTGIGIINLLFTMAGMSLIDRFGRRSLMLIGSFGLILTLGLVSISFFTEQYGGVPWYLFIYIAFFAMSQGAVIWVFISEIFPNQVRAAGQAFGSFTHWIMAAIIANIFPPLAENLGGGPVFLFFTIMMILQLIFVWKLMPETKGMSLEEIEKTMIT